MLRNHLDVRTLLLFAAFVFPDGRGLLTRDETGLGGHVALAVALGAGAPAELDTTFQYRRGDRLIEVGGRVARLVPDELAPLVRADHLVISVAAGISLGSIESALPEPPLVEGGLTELMAALRNSYGFHG